MDTGLSIQLQCTSEAEIPVDDVVLEGGGCYSVDCACSLQFVQIIVKLGEKSCAMNMIMWQTIKISCAQPLFVISTIARSTSCIVVIEALGKQLGCVHI